MISRIQHPLCILNMGYFKFIVGVILNVNKAVKIFMAICVAISTCLR